MAHVGPTNSQMVRRFMNNLMGRDRESLIGEYFLKNGFSFSERDHNYDYDDLPPTFRNKLSKLRDAAQDFQKECRQHGV